MSDPWFVSMPVKDMTLPVVEEAITALRRELLATEAYTIYRDAQAKKWNEDGQVGRRITDMKADQDRLSGAT